MNTTTPRTAGDIMRRTLVAVRPDQKLSEAERLLVDHNITGMPVIEGQKLVGMLSRSDLTRAHVLADALDGQIRHELHWDETQADGFRGRDPERFEGVAQRCGNVRVRDVMRSQVVTCDVTAPVAKVAQLLVQHHIHRIIVVEGDKPVGIISSLDLVKLLVGT
jgi:CBS domain-containing protein